MTSAETRRFKFGVIFLAATSFAAIVLAAWALYARFQESNAYREADARIWHAVVCQIEQAVLKQHLSPVKERKALRFYDHLLVADVRTDGCGLIEKGKP